MMTTEKEVSFSYPSSDNATKFGFYGTGCYTVSTGAAGKPKKSVSGHATSKEAFTAADKLSMPYGRFSLKRGQTDQDQETTAPADYRKTGR
jgi:hypothetical protein